MPANAPTPRQALLTLRIVWFALLAGEAAFFAVVALFILPQNVITKEPQSVLTWISLGMCVAIIPAMFMIRQSIFGRARGAHGGGGGSGAIPPGPFATGNIIFWAGCEGVAFFGLVV